jgi:hypothetical protein
MKVSKLENTGYVNFYKIIPYSTSISEVFLSSAKEEISVLRRADEYWHWHTKLAKRQTRQVGLAALTLTNEPVNYN